ncbi:MAG TPA: hypothetical protein QGG77_04385, partial [Prochlorococcaceae cyanobacterium Gl_MAG_24]|nr:hypothetical protein [Prochlorococcaceae cyanobacterium Gl_MAG_24]
MIKYLSKCGQWISQGILLMLISLSITYGLLEAQVAIAGPVEWREVPATDAGQQWWDLGSLHY